ncbi:hypothetical protein Ciccas_010440 [Cichlidogyrus casuarinus]|uniref:C2H2-type domain-containing protein n=1 Tax=Cichlidogyrus casuarinus TaxID=1844966 RepID=A0ABD2PU70_9PLAT
MLMTMRKHHSHLQKSGQTCLGMDLSLNGLSSDLKFSHSAFNDIITGLTPTDNRPGNLPDGEWKDYSNINNVDTPTITADIASFIDTIQSSQSFNEENILIPLQCNIEPCQQAISHIEDLDQRRNKSCFDKTNFFAASNRNSANLKSSEFSEHESSIKSYCQSLTGTSSISILSHNPDMNNLNQPKNMDQESVNSYNSSYTPSIIYNSSGSQSALRYEDDSSHSSHSRASVYSQAPSTKVSFSSPSKRPAPKNFRNGHTYTGAKPHQCDFQDCEKRFARVDELRRHKRTHNNFKPYACDRCDKKFTRSDHLTTHKRTHTGEKPYECEKCSKCFARSDERYRHMKTHDKPRRCGRKPKRLLEQHDLSFHEAKPLEDADFSV